MRVRLPTTLALAIAVGACQPAPRHSTATPANAPAAATTTQAVVRGRATYLERVKMPPGADLVVQLLDNRLADAPAAVVASVRLDDVAGPPYDFALPYDPARLRADGRYGLHASLYGPEGELWFVTDTRVPVSPGSADVVEFRMVRVPGAGEAPPPAAASPWQDAKARGVAFRGVGNEPGWFVEVDPGRAPALRTTLDYGERKLDVQRVSAVGPGYTGRTADGTAVTLSIVRGSCSDGMSDETYPASAELTVGNRTYLGCGRFLAE